jgi:uncharacterized protein (DUF433 family)
VTSPQSLEIASRAEYLFERRRAPVTANPRNGSVDIYGGQSPLELPAYAVSEAALYLDVPLSTVRSWVSGRSYDTKGGKRRSQPIIAVADPKGPTLSFHDLVEVHVLAAITRRHKVRLQAVRAAVHYLRDALGKKRPLLESKMLTDGADLFVEHYGDLVNVTHRGQLAMKKVLELHLRRIGRDAKGVPIRLFPFTTSRRDVEETRPVTIDPRLQFGRPCIAGTGIPTLEVAERYKAGESIQELSEDFGCTEAQVEAAIRYELRAAA